MTEEIIIPSKHRKVKCECGEWMKLQVCSSFAGYYLGYWCSECGPYQRVSEYLKSEEQAERALSGANYD